MSKSFIHEPITVEFDEAPTFSKVPHCPDRFVWREITYTVVELLSEWKDFGRRGRMQHTMRPSNRDRALERGSWGVGEFHFEVRATAEDSDEVRAFELYYDRAPKSADDRVGQWFLQAEIDV
ncbi:MAG: hypothetical protein GYB64_16450 [Chloroflexi bacterium]|nr:hypothetical protein [Chloroflexota bacterium]